MRGEELGGVKSISWSSELPPHARRRATEEAAINGDGGITSACAEKRFQMEEAAVLFGNYLRMRGEELRTYSHAEDQ